MSATRHSMIRRASIADANGINDVYNPYIVESSSTFETDPVSLEMRQSWLRERLSNPRHDVFVAENENDETCGFSNAGPFDERSAYAVSVKVSVFINAKMNGQGIGIQLYERLFASLAEKDVHRAYALIVEPNPASVRLHERFGFSHISTLNEVGRKFGRYYSVLWFEKRFE